MRSSALLVMSVGLLLMAGSVWLAVDPVFIWNRTDSVPKGLYFVHKAPLEHGRLVAYRPTDSENAWLAKHGITPGSWPLLKQIAALKGDAVCWNMGAVSVNGHRVSTQIAGVEYQAFEGCVVLRSNEVLLMNEHPRSVDGRYFGIQKTDRIIGIAEPIWTSMKADIGVKSGEESADRVRRSRRARFKARLTEPPTPLSAHRFFCADSAELAEYSAHPASAISKMDHSLAP